MSSWVQLLLALLAACLFGIAEGDALPAALVELVRKSPISSIEDLQLLLLTDSTDAQPAQQALCKVRTEVVEVTRAMLDRSNANFLLWPPCVEVQRCSGCCNTKSLKCLPIVTHTRYLQVMKIEYINKRPTYAKAVVSFVDHVECRCQPTPHSPGPRKKSSRKQHSHHRNETLSQEQVKVHSKDELHQWDELKQNQRVHLDDLLQQQWSPRGDTFTQPGEGYSLAGEDTSWSGEAIFFAPHWPHKSTRLLDTKDQTEKQENVERIDGRVSDGRKTTNIGIQVKETLIEDGEELSHNNTEMKVNEYTQTQDPLRPGSKSNFSKSHTSSHFQRDTLNPTEETTKERLRSRFRTAKQPNPDPSEQTQWRQNKTPEERRVQTEETTLEERKELLHFHQRMDQEEILKRQQIRREEENRLKEEETNSQQHLHDKHLQTTTTTTTTTTQKPETTTSTATTQQPSAAEASKLLPRSNQTRRRMRKNRKRISKAAMRAMLM